MVWFMPYPRASQRTDKRRGGGKKKKKTKQKPRAFAPLCICFATFSENFLGTERAAKQRARRQSGAEQSRALPSPLPAGRLCSSLQLLLEATGFVRADVCRFIFPSGSCIATARSTYQRASQVSSSTYFKTNIKIIFLSNF